MKVIVAGSRTGVTWNQVCRAILMSGYDVTEVVSGGAEGADKLGEDYAERIAVPVKRFNANWSEYGRAAGPIRNREMAEYADALVAVWNGESPGTRNMISEAMKRGLAVHVHNTRDGQLEPKSPFEQTTLLGPILATQSIE